MLWNKFNLFTFNIICNIILSITKKTACIWKFGIVDDGTFKLRPQLPVCFGFTIVAVAANIVQNITTFCTQFAGMFDCNVTISNTCIESTFYLKMSK